MKSAWEENKKNDLSSNGLRQKEITRIEEKLRDIETVMAKTKHVELYERLDLERGTINAEKELLEEEIAQSVYTEEEYINLVEKTI